MNAILYQAVKIVHFPQHAFLLLWICETTYTVPNNNKWVASFSRWAVICFMSVIFTLTGLAMMYVFCFYYFDLYSTWMQTHCTARAAKRNVMYNTRVLDLHTIRVYWLRLWDISRLKIVSAFWNKAVLRVRMRCLNNLVRLSLCQVMLFMAGWLSASFRTEPTLDHIPAVLLE